MKRRTGRDRTVEEFEKLGPPGTGDNAATLLTPTTLPLPLTSAIRLPP